MTVSLIRLTALSALALLVLAAPRPALCETAGSKEKTRYEYAESLYMQGAYDSAVTELAGFVKDYPKGDYTDDAHYWLGKYYLNAGRASEGIEQLNIILSLMPGADKAPAAQFELAYYWFDHSVKGRDPERAMAEFMKIPFFYPESPLVDDARYYAASCQAELGRYAQAEQELKDFITAQPSSEFAPPAGYRLGIVYLLDGRPGEALAAFQSVRDAYPAGLYAGRALEAVELLARARDAKQPREEYRLGGKGEAPGSLYKPLSLACDPEGGLYVADSGNSRVQRFGLSGGKLAPDIASVSPDTLEKPMMMDEPSGVAVGPDGRIYVTDSALCRVQVFAPGQGLVGGFGRKGSGPGELGDPRGIAVDEGGFVYVADKANKRVNVYDQQGMFERAIGAATQQNQDKALKAPVAVAIDIRGNLLVADDSADRLYAYDRKGNLVMLYDKDPSGRFEVKDPAGIAVDGVGNVYLTNMGRGTVTVFDKDLKPVMEFGGVDKPAGIAVSGKGEIFVSDYATSQLVVFK